MSMWESLTTEQRARWKAFFASQGIYKESQMERQYNSMYLSKMENVAELNYKNWGYNNADEALVHALNDNTYDYNKWFADDPGSTENSETHWTDRYKTAYHGTMSNLSIYSGVKDRNYNPEGLEGGYWNGNDFVPADLLNKKQIGGWIAKQWYNKNVLPVIDDVGIDEVRRRIYDNVLPRSYDNAVKRVKAALNDKSAEKHNYGYDMDRDDIFATYLGIPLNKRHSGITKKVVRSQYSPTISPEPNVQYYKIGLTDKNKKEIVDSVFGLNYYEARENRSPINIGQSKLSTTLDNYFGEHTVSRGVDPTRGEYVSYYDKWDLAPVFGSWTWGSGNNDLSLGLGTPVNFYDRIYLNDYYDVNATPLDGTYYGGWITPVIVTPNEYSKGGIMIKPSHRGRLTELKKRTGKTEAELWKTGSKAVRKMITFARNARKWKHLDGGYLDDIIWDNMGLWNHPGLITGITGTKNGTDITMNGVADYLIGKDNLGNVKFMKPGRDYHFPGSSVVEYPLKYQFGGLFKKKETPNYLYTTYGLNDYGQPRYEGSYNNPIFGYQPLFGINQSIGRDYSMPDYNAVAITSTPLYMNEDVGPRQMDLVDLKNRQLFVESRGNVNAKSYRGASGLYLIMPDTAKWYADSTGNKGDIWNPVYNELIRDWLMERLYNYDWAKSAKTDEERWRRAYAGYNWGSGNMSKTINKYGDDWFSHIPKETKNYVNFIVDNIDVNDYITNDKYNETKKSNKYFKQYGGLVKPFSYTDIPVVRYGNGGNLFLGDLSEMKVLPTDSEGLPYYTFPDIEISSTRLPEAKSTDTNINRYANAVVNGLIRLTLIPNTELRNRVRAKPIVDRIISDRDSTALPVLQGTIGMPAAIIGGISAIPYIPNVINFIGNPASSIAKAVKASPVRINQMKLVDDAYNTYLTAQGVKDYIGENGVRKTYNFLKEGDYGSALKSGALDALDLFTTGISAVSAARKTIPVVKNIASRNKYVNNVWDNYITMRDAVEANPFSISKQRVASGDVYRMGNKTELGKPKITVSGHYDDGSLAYHDFRDNKIHVRPSTYFDSNEAFLTYIGHETRHGVQHNLVRDWALGQSNKGTEFITNRRNMYLNMPSHKFKSRSIADVLGNNGRFGTWEGSIEEIDADVLGLLNNYKEVKGLDKIPRFESLSNNNKRIIYNSIEALHELLHDEAKLILETLSNLGYF